MLSLWPAAWSRQQRSSATMITASLGLLLILWLIPIPLAMAPEPIGNNAQLFADGTRVTVQLTVVSGLFGVLLGIVAALGKVSRIAPLRWLAGFYIWVMRGTPLLVQVLFVYFALPELIPWLRLNEFSAACVALALNVGAYNAEAIRAGLMDKAEIARLLRVLAERRRQYQLRTVSFVLLPPYPEGFFPHPLLRSPWSYQNGGEWDWIGGRLVSALYQTGFRAEAEKYLKEIAEKNLAEMNIFEWSDRGGGGQGASFYAGAAGVLGEAILAGHFGLGEDFDRYTLSAGPERFSLTVAKAGDRFTIDNSANLSIEITSLSKKEICVLAAANNKKNCVSKKGKTEIPKK